MTRALLAALAITALPINASAGPHKDRLEACIVEHTSVADERNFARWMVIAVAAHPDVADLSSVTPQAREKAQRSFASIFERLMTIDCAAETSATYRYEGERAASNAFEVFGSSAMQGLMSDPSVAAEMTAYAQHLDQEAIDNLTGVRR